MIRCWILLPLLGCCCLLKAQESYRIMFYNVENLFDTRDDSLTLDNEFTFKGKKHWSTFRYRSKLKKLAEVVDSVGAGKWPLAIGMAEVENRWVLEDLTGKTVLADGHYGIVHQDSPDRRGIDVALLYRKDLLKMVNTEFLRIPFPENRSIRTRDILYAKGMLGEDTIHFFVCHFPSMLGGERQSEWKRERAAAVLRHKVDSLFAVNPAAGILVMGDLNGKANTAAQKVLGTGDADKKIREGKLYHTGRYLLGQNYGSYRYRGKWETIDHIIVSGGLLKQSVYRAERRMKVYRASFLLEEEKGYFGFKPFPTYRGMRYVGGYSDHLPVFIDLSSEF